MTTISQPPNIATGARYRNAAEWWHALGDVPLNRILFEPLPGTATEADVLRLDDHEDRLCELVDGTLIEKAMGYEESLIACRIIYFLQAWVRPRKLGVVSGEAGMLRILTNRVRIPDVAFVSYQRMPGGKVPSDRIPSLSPDLAVEVLSESNTRREIEIKRGEYFQSGTSLVWVVDPKSRVVEVYHPSEELPQQFGMSDTLSGETVLAGLEIKVRDIFED